MAVTFSIGDTDQPEERDLLERRRVLLPTTVPPPQDRTRVPSGWVLDDPKGSDDDQATTWAW